MHRFEGSRRSVRGWTILLAVGVVIAVVAPASARAWQEPPRSATKFYPDFSDDADLLLRNAAGHVAAEQWTEAVAIYRRIIEQYGDKVARLPKDEPGADPTGESTLYVDLRQFCQRRLAALPAEARAIYRSQVDERSRRWFEEGSRGRDRALLRRVVDEAYCGSWGDDALEMLGDLAFQDGRFDEALSAYRRLAPEAGARPTGLPHPDPSIDLGRVAAKALLCRAARGVDAPGASDLDAYARAYPKAAGELAGRKGLYVATLKAALADDALAPPARPDGRWPTFAGAPTRTRVMPATIDVGTLQWRVPLNAFDPYRNVYRNVRQMGMGNPRTPDARMLLAYHPIVLGDQVVVCDDNAITAYNLNDRANRVPDGVPAEHKPLWRYENQNTSAPPAMRPQGLPRFTLTAYGDRIFAKFGANYLGFPGRMPGFGMGGGNTLPSYIAAVDRATDGKLLWKLSSTQVALPKRVAEGGNRHAGFEGTPVADARHVYVAMTDRRELTSTYVACLDAETGATRWVRYLGAASSDADNVMVGMGMMGGGNSWPSSGDFGHRLLTLDGPTLYYQTNLGAIAALDAESGALRWVATYPRVERNGSSDRDLNPAIAHDGLVIAAPDDAQSIFGFDAATGRIVWKTAPVPDEVKLAHLLGVSKGRLVATGDRVLLYDVKTGKLLHVWPDSGRSFEGYGRGLLAGDKIYWPTRGEIHVLDQTSGVREGPPIKLSERFQTTGGNLAVGDGYLIVAQADALVVFCQNSRLIQRYREEIARAPERASNYYWLAQAAEATGDDAAALDALTQALRRAQPSEMIDGGLLVDGVRDRRYALLTKLAAAARAKGDLTGAADRFEEASRAARGPRDRLRALLSLSEAQSARGRPRDAVATLQNLLADEGLRGLQLAVEDGHRNVRADLLITDRLATVLREQGRAYYEPYEQAARRQIEAGIAEKSTRRLEQAARLYPVSEALPEAYLALATLHDAAGRPDEAAQSYRRLLAGAVNDEQRGRALWGLARSYEARKLWVPAREEYTRILSRFANLRVDGLPGVDPRADAGATLGSLASRRLARGSFEGLDVDRGGSSAPWVRVWERTLAEPSRPLSASGAAPSGDAGRIFLARGDALESLDPVAGKTRWRVDLGGAPVWVGYLADKVVAASSLRLAAISIDLGTVEWRYDAARGGRPARGPDPFAAPAAAQAGGEVSDQGLHDFRIVEGRVFCRRGDRELLAFDGDTGLVDWSFAPSEGTINPRLWVGSRRIALQTLRPSIAYVLETTSGRILARKQRSEDEEWARDPFPIDEDRLAIVSDRRTVAMFNLDDGSDAWVFRESDELPRHGPPRFFGDAGRLLLMHDAHALIRLDANSGRKLWTRSLLVNALDVEDLSERPDAVAVDDRRVYWTCGRTLNAATLEHGKLAWSEPLFGPSAGWSVALARHCVAAYPGAEIPGESEARLAPIVFREREDGRLAQRLIFPDAAAELTVRFTPNAALVATRSHVWGLAPRAALDPPAAAP